MNLPLSNNQAKGLSPNTRVAFVTSQALPFLSDDDRLAVAALHPHGVTVVPTIWNDTTVDWNAFDAIVIRSTWDYYLAFDAFRAWIDRIEATGVPVLNPPQLVRWNSNKEYLRELDERGASRIVPTTWVPQGDSRSLVSILTSQGWDNAVVKPVVSAGANDTWRTNLAEVSDHETRFHELVARGMAMVQPFLSTITTAGEWSLLFFNGMFSHAVRKVPQRGDFRVQSQYGATNLADEPDADLIASSERLVRSIMPLPLYARVDGCVEGGKFLLMELELIEPNLYLGQSTHGAERFAKALVEVLEQGRDS